MVSTLLDWLVEHEPSFRKNRLPSLYSDLSIQRSSNPEGYAANVTAWTSALTRLTLAAQLPPEQHHFILQTSNDLLSALASPTYGEPSGLGCVLDECLRQGKMVDLKEFIAMEKSIYSKSWISIPRPLDVLKWGLQQVGVVKTGSYDLSGGRLRGGSLVVVAALEDLWKNIQAARQKGGHNSRSLTDRILSREAFLKQINHSLKEGHSPLSELDVAVFLRYLARDKQALSYDETTIKFKPSAAADSVPEPITQEDRHIASLKHLIDNLTSQIEILHTRISTFQSTAQTAVKQNNKVSALSALRSKKLAERTLSSRSATLHQLEEVYTKIEDAVDQVQVVQAMEASAGVLKNLNKQVGGVERVEDVLESLREEMGLVDEVSGVIAEPLDVRTVLDEGEVDDELEAMEREEKERAQAKEAEDTKRRLMEVEALELERSREQERIRREKEREKENEKLEQDLSTSVEKLQTLDLRTQARGQGSETQLQEKTSQLAQKQEQEEINPQLAS